MTKSQGLRIVTEWEAERVLLDHGYTKVQCPRCNGVGHFPIPINDHQLLDDPTVGAWGRCCDHCEGQGWRWQAPLVRELPSETKTTT